MSVHYRAISDLDRSLRAVTTSENGGEFEGYASLHGVTDSFGTYIVRGAWTAGGLDTKPYALLVFHDRKRVAGTFTAVEDDIGLYIRGRFDRTTEGQEARERARTGSSSELSVGFARQDGGDNTSPSAITSARLLEVSLITARMASLPGAALAGVRSADVFRPHSPVGFDLRLRTAAALDLLDFPLS